LRIRSLEINGFKSFADRAVLAFDRGISAIVGPNGCGKSNVVDAIRWVMGEQNPRHLRGRLMDDVIFAGTERRAPVGMAEVVLTLDNSDGTAPPQYAGFEEIQISRRLYGSGESEYLINRVPVRMRDVADFFLDTGVGTRGYTIVEQGQIVSIVSSKPEDRRFIIEEAAGIGKYRQRRIETERKLAATEQNLLRVNDVLGELRRQIGSLDRQARKASRYKELASQIRELELRVASEELAAHDARLAELAGELERLAEEEVALDARAASAAARLEAERAAHLERQNALQRSREALLALRNEIQALEGRIEYERREREGLLELAGSREGELLELEQQLAAHRAAQAEVLQDLAAAEERLSRDEGELEQRAVQLRDASEQEATLRGRREALQARAVDLSTEAATLRSRVEALGERRTELEQALRVEESALETSAVERDQTRGDEETLEQRVRTALAEQDEFGRSVAALLRAQGEAASQREELERKLAGARDRHERAIARLESLREAQRADSASSAEVLERLAEPDRRTLRGRLADVLEVDEGYERALESVLGPRLDALLVGGPEDALALLARLRETQAGRLVLLPAAQREEESLAGFVPLGQRLYDRVSAKPPFEALVRRVLDGIYVVDDLGEALRRYGVSRPPAVFVTRAGEVLDQVGALTGGSAAPPGILSRAGEIRRVERELEGFASERAGLERRVEAEAERVRTLGQELDNARSRRHTAELAVLHYEKDLEHARERTKTTERQMESHREAHGRASDQIQSLGREAAQLEERLALIGSERASSEWELERVGNELSAATRTLRALEERLVQQRVELAELSSRRERLRGERERLRAAIDEGREWLARRREEVRAARERADSLTRSLAQASTDVDERIAREEALRVEQERLREAWEAGERAVADAEEQTRGGGREREALRERLSSVELGRQEARLRRDQLVERARERHQIELADYRPAEGDARSPGERREELARLQQSLQALGDVHLGAIEEYEEVSERFRYLTQQKEDLDLSIERLKSAIARINRTSRTRFRETFDAVNEEFQKLFPRLFRGGRAHLSLTATEDLLDAGIEIHAQPPGKKLQTVNLLSGGEKSLTAIALLFAVFTVKPSPFFLLDEVDAALDDANVGRFNELVAEMARNSQLLMITHNKRTIEIANTLYGITMEEQGLSKLVTVDLVA
jgi:chromosome segregation protein